MAKNGSSLSVRLSEIEQATYDKVLKHYNAVSPSRSKSFKLLLQALAKVVDDQNYKDYWNNMELDPPETT